MTDPICPPGTAFASEVNAVRLGEYDVDHAVRTLLAQLTDDEILWLLDGDLPLGKGMLGLVKRYNAVPVEAGRVDRLGIPGIRFADGPRGVVPGSSSAFPVAIARAATFDPDIERAVGDAIGAEARAQGANLFAGICINLAYAPGWGRSQESYGEDPILLGAMGAALTKGVNPWVMSCVKHYALNSMEEARFIVDVQVEEDVLHEVYLPHFRATVEAGVDSVMSAYNSVNGTWAGDNRHLLTEILRQDWGFSGFVMTDFIWGLRSPVESVAAGQDLEMPFRQQRAKSLPAALRSGRLARPDVERAATRLLRAQVELALRAQPEPGPEVVASLEHRELAREVARRGAVLLRNEVIDGLPMLPLQAETLGHVAVIGALADQINQGDVGSSRVHPPFSSTILEGLRERLGDRVVHFGSKDQAAAADAARAADVAVLVVGLSSVDEGESMIGADATAIQLMGGLAGLRPLAGTLARIFKMAGKKMGMGGDRQDLRLHPDDVALVQAVAAANPRTVVVVIGGGTVVVDPWDVEVAALLLAWYPGMEGGRAIADVLLGVAEPSGRLPLTIPHSREDLPIVDWNARSVRYDRWWGQRKLDRDGIKAAYPFGFGLGYTTFALTELEVGAVAEEHFPTHVTVTNTGNRAGRHVVQVYTSTVHNGLPIRELVGFRPVRLDPGQSQQVIIDCSTRPLQRWTADGFVLDARAVRIEAGSFSGDPHAQATELELPAWPVAADPAF